MRYYSSFVCLYKRLTGTSKLHNSIATLKKQSSRTRGLSNIVSKCGIDSCAKPIDSSLEVEEVVGNTVDHAYGIRNSFGIDFDPVTGKLWDTENGPYYGDEINLFSFRFTRLKLWI